MTTSDDLSVRPITEDEFLGWHRAVRTGFLMTPTLTDEELEARRAQWEPGRLLGAFDEGRCVATFRSFAQEITAVGGSFVPADAVSNVTVTATHRRRGLLSRMMAMDLAAAKERGDVVATLIAAEYPIYGRFGFGPAGTTAEWTVDVPRTGLGGRASGQPEAEYGGGRIDLVDAADVRKLGPELHDRFRRVHHGAVSRVDLWWSNRTGATTWDSKWTMPFFAVYRSADGEVQGMAAYRCDDKWTGDQPDVTAEVEWLIADTPAAERALWHYLCSIDWVTRIKTDRRAPDDLLPLYLPDPRAARITTQGDWLWVRILDVVRALEARTYQGEGSLVLEVADAGGFTGGRFRLDASADGASCVPTVEDAELTLGVGELASLWLGDESAGRLAAVGRVREERAGAARKADALLRTSRRPFCPDMF